MDFLFFKKAYSKEDQSTTTQMILKDFNFREKIEKLTFYSAKILCKRNYLRKIDKSHIKIVRELDL